MTPDEVREQVLQELEPFRRFKGVEDLFEKVSNGSSGETLVLINACKTIQVAKNWIIEARSTLTMGCLSPCPLKAIIAGLFRG